MDIKILFIKNTIIQGFQINKFDCIHVTDQIFHL